MMKLNTENLQNLGEISVPNYDRDKLTPGIVHIGLGNFHRAHQAWYLHRLMQMGLAYDWAIIGAGVRANDDDMRKRLEAQDYLTTLIELSPDSRSAEVTGSMIDFLPVEPNNGALIDRLAQADIRIVATTVTEGGYFIDPATKGFDAQHEDIIHDAANPSTPRTAFGAIVAALRIRRENGVGPITCQSCDNLLGNGDVMRQTIVSLARLNDPDLADWINENCSFPSSMVDSIVPATGPAELALVKEFGIFDEAPVTHENYRQWVIEDEFVAGRPEWERVGATITPNVHDYETMKIRILNAGHQVIAAVGDLVGIDTISGAIGHPSISALFDKVEREEIMPHVEAVPEFTPEEYVELIHRRFSNDAIVDTTRRVAFDGSSRQPGFVLPNVYDCLDKGITPNGLALVSALWARYCVGTREDGSQIDANDPFWDQLQKRAVAAKSDPKEWLENRTVYGDLAKRPEFAAPFVKWMMMIDTDGVEAAMEAYSVGG